MTMQPYKGYFIAGSALLVSSIQPGLVRWRQRFGAGPL